MASLTIGRALAARRRDTGLDQETVAASLGVSRSTYASYERGTRRPSAETLRAVALFLDVSIDAVLDLYGATCVEQARRVLEPDSHDGGPTTSPSRVGARRHDVAVIERVYFEAAGSSATHDDGVPAPPDATSAVDVAPELERVDTGPPREAVGDEPRTHPAAMTAWSSEVENADAGQGKRGEGKRGKDKDKGGQGKRGKRKRGKRKRGKGKGGKGKGGKGKGEGRLEPERRGEGATIETTKRERGATKSRGRKNKKETRRSHR